MTSKNASEAESQRIRTSPLLRHGNRAVVPSKDVPSHGTLAQFQFGPATQTTVVTTTTTTTTKFPPFVLPAPRQINDLDLKVYPLAGTPTPASLRNIGFQLNGKTTIFREAADTSLALEQLQEEQAFLRKGNGTIQVVESNVQPQSTEYHGELSPSAQLLQSLSEQPASPESITEQECEQERISESPAHSTRSKRAGKQKVRLERDRRYHPRLREMQNTNPITPDTQIRPARVQRPRHERNSEVNASLSQPLLPSPDTEHHHLMTSRRDNSPLVFQQNFDDDMSSIRGSGRSLRPMISRSSHDSIVPTPPIEPEEQHASSRQLPGRALSSIPSRLHVTDSPSAHDGTLPSPSLSPVTAAANAQHAGYFADVDSSSELASQHGHSFMNVDSLYGQTPSHSRYDSPAATDASYQDEPWQTVARFSGVSMTDIPAMLDFFEALPDELKSYVMHQLLRRCPKPTLHVVADAVNPALKCDFLVILPPELALNILSYLDVRSLCRASQVSRKWRQMINSDERAWKELFDANGFVLPDGELQRSIMQGWGWQDPYGVDGFEMDIGNLHGTKSESEAGSPTPSLNASKKSTHTSTLRRSKRKAATMLSSRNKMVKRAVSREASDEIDVGDWAVQKLAAEGPYNAAHAALLAVPHPQLPLSGLKGLHLYKSLYRRHHLIRRNWMMEDTRPRHIAFRAHDSHVVTCLQFDTDKILTGSDDNNINVYDTRTGKLRQLLKGHEGGVWALQYEGNTLVSGSTDRSVRVWDIEQGLETQVFRGHTSTVRCLQIVPPVKVGENAEGKPIMMPKHALIITGSRDSTLRVWRLPRPTDPVFIQAESDAESDDCPYFVRSLTGHQHSVRAIAAHADTLVSGSYDCTVRVWRISTGETIHRLQGHSQKVYSVVLDHARNRCISGSMDNLVKIWSLETGSALYTLEGHSSLVGLLDLNCERLVSAAADSTLRIWDPENGQCKATLSAHTGAITCFQHDAQKVISGSDRTLKMWNIKTGECMKDLLSDLSGVWQVKFNERRCVAAVQRDNMTFIEVLDFGAARDGIPENQRGRRIVVNALGEEILNEDDPAFFD